MDHGSDQRHVERAERLRLEAARRRRQRVWVPLVLVALALSGAALTWRPTSAAQTAAPEADAVASATVPAARAETSASVQGTASVAATASASASSSADTSGQATVAAMKPLKPAPGVKTIVVDKSEQRVSLYKADGTPVDTFRCASGVTYPRVGTYSVYGHRAQSWSEYDDSTFYFFTMFVKSDKGNNIGFHSIPVKPDGTLVGKLGVPVSHGCVRLDKAKAKFVYTWAPAGTRVVVRR